MGDYSKETKDLKMPGRLAKVPSGIKGFDEITYGGLPRGRTALVCGGAGSGKTLFAMEFLLRGATEFGEPGVFMSFEESEADLASNFASLGFDLETLERENKVSFDYVHIERTEIEETGAYDLEGLFVRLGLAIDSMGARRVVLDTLESLFAGFPNHFILRSEIRRLFRWLKDKGVTAVITAEAGFEDTAITRHGLEEYVSDCVIVLDHRVKEQVSTRRLRVMKYRGSIHGTNEYPFLIDEGGIFVLPITSVELDYDVSSERVSSGIPKLDAMLSGKGFYRGSSILVSGYPGTGKTSMACQFVNYMCDKGQRCLYYAFEESSRQIIRNMHSIGLDLAPFINRELLRIIAIRPTFFGLEMHLAQMLKQIEDHNPSTVILDPISNLSGAGKKEDVKLMLIRLTDLLKARNITSLFTSLIPGPEKAENPDSGVSSLMDAWIMLRQYQHRGERIRGLNIIKSRGMANSSQMRRLLITEKGLDLLNMKKDGSEN